MEGIVDFHHDIMFIIIFIVIAVYYMLSVILVNYTKTSENNSKAVIRGSHHTVLEIV
jgi:heme/copper-type cytochrome/quinol oxidase subunit 2